MTKLPMQVSAVLRHGVVIPAHPLALTSARKLDERRQRALSRYYLAAGAGGLAVGVHTTQFAIRKPEIGLFEPVLTLAAEEMTRAQAGREEPIIRVAGVIGETTQAVAEAALASRLGYNIALVSLAALTHADDVALIAHCRAVAEVMPIMGFYLQPAVGGRLLSEQFWARFAEIENVVAVKVAPFNRYQTLDVVKGVAASGRLNDIALYTGNDDNIVLDLLTPFRITTPNGNTVSARFCGGLLGHWAVWTSRAVHILEVAHKLSNLDTIPRDVLTLAAQITEANAAVFDAANGYAGVIAGVHEVLRRQGLLAGRWCLDPREGLSRGQAAQIQRICDVFPHLTDDDFVAEHLDEWLA
jgi:dihydrodipicolinate synthase/N-acetylneuraminate lyase